MSDVDQALVDGMIGMAVAQVAAAEKWPRVVKLKHPVDLGSEHITELTFRRGRMGDLKGLKVDGVPPAEQLMLLASRMCGKQIQVIEKLDAEDGAEVLGVALDFFARCLGVTKTA
jgi:hypothetical protein